MALEVEKAREALRGGREAEIKTCLLALEGQVTPEAIAALAEALGSPFWALRKLAANLLIEMGEPAVEAMAALTRSDNLDQVYWACFVLARLGPGASGPLSSVLRSPIKAHRLYAIHALGRRKGDDSIKGLVEALDDAVWTHRQKAADALASRPDRGRVVEVVKDEISKGNRNRVYWGVRVLSRILGVQTLPILKKLLAWKDDDLRYLAISALGTLRSEESIPLLIDYLADRSHVVREKAVEALASLGPGVREAILARLPQSAAEVKPWLLRVLVRLDPMTAFDLCGRYLTEGDEETRYVAVRVLGQMRTDGAYERLVGCFKNPLWVIRKFASDALSGCGEPAIETLRRAMRDRDEDVQYWAIATLGMMGAPAFRCLKEALTQGDRSARGFAIGALVEASAARDAALCLSMVLDDEHWPLRRQAAQAIGGLGPAALPVVMGQACDRSEHVRHWSRQIARELHKEGTARMLAWLDGQPEAVRTRACHAIRDTDASTLVGLLERDPAEAVRAMEDRSGASGRDEGVEAPDLVVAPSAPAMPVVNLDIAVLESDPGTYLDVLLARLEEQKGTDLHIRPHAAPLARVDGQLVRWEAAPLSPHEVEKVLQGVVTQDVRERVDREGFATFGFELARTRYRAKVFREARGLGAVFRAVPLEPPAMRELGLDGPFEEMVAAGPGFLLLSGLAGSGLSSTLAAFVHAINGARRSHVVAIESPVEIIHPSRRGAVTQRDVPADVATYRRGLVEALALDPDAVALGDLPDGESALLALEAARMGQLVIACLAATGAVEAVERLLGMVANERRATARSLLAGSMRGVVWQTLVPHSSGRGRVAAREVIVPGPSVASLLMAWDLAGIRRLLDESPTEAMRGLDTDLRRLVARGAVDEVAARGAARNKASFEPSPGTREARG